MHKREGFGDGCLHQRHARQVGWLRRPRRQRAGRYESGNTGLAHVSLHLQLSHIVCREGVGSGALGGPCEWGGCLHVRPCECDVVSGRALNPVHAPL
jgi:hypothetical protein